jgi:hypothetical protein
MPLSDSTSSSIIQSSSNGDTGPDAVPAGSNANGNIITDSNMSDIALQPPQSSESESLLRALDLIFNPTETLNERIENSIDWLSLFNEKQERLLFLRELDSRRGGCDCALLQAQFYLLVEAVKVFLDECVKHEDIMSATRTANMANTFYCVVEETETEPNQGNFKKDTRKKYIQTELLSHPIWRLESFWEQVHDISMFAIINYDDQYTLGGKKCHYGSVRNARFVVLGRYGASFIS